MGETFKGNISTPCTRFDRELPDFLLETQKAMLSIEKLLAELIEKGGDLSAAQKKNLRAQIQQIWQSLGVASWEEYYKFTDLVYQEMNEHLTNPVAPNYPSREDFSATYHQVINQSKEVQRPSVPSKPFASEVAVFGTCEWQEVDGRGEVSIIDYAYNLGRVMADINCYTQVIDQGDTITVSGDWHIENGRHRALALVTLGEDYVSRVGMDRWVEVEREN